MYGMTAERPMIIEFKRAEIPATRYVVNVLKKEMNLDLSPLQCEVFILLMDNGGQMTQKHLEGCLDVSKSTLSGVLKTMCKNGFVTKEASEKDRRVTVVTLTEKGQIAYSEAMRLTAELDRTVFAGLDDEEAAALRRALEKVRANTSSTN